MKILGTAIEDAAAIALPQIAARLEEATSVLAATGGEALSLGQQYAARIASFVQLAIDGTLPSNIATTAIEREIAALEELGAGVTEKVAAEAIGTAKSVLKIAAKVAVQLVAAVALA